MILPGTKVVKVSSLKLPGDIPQRQRRSDVVALAASRKARGALSLPIVDESDNTVVCGNDRLAAELLLKAKTVEVRVFRGDAKERRKVVIEENLRRRHDDRDALLAELVALETEAVEAERAEVTPDKVSGVAARPGPAKTAKGEARERVAAAQRTTTEAVRAAEKRAAAAAAPEEPDDAGAEEPDEQPSPVECWGVVDLTEQQRAELYQIQWAIEAAETLRRRAVAELAKLELLPIGNKLLQRLTRDLDAARGAFKAHKPAAVCPTCKLLPPRTPTCGACQGIGFVAEDALTAIADELKLGGDQAMVIDGRGGFVPYARAAKERAPGAPPAALLSSKAMKPHPKRVKIIDDTTGRELVPPVDDVPPPGDEDAP